MRIWVPLLAALLFSACDSGDIPSPAERLNNPDAAIEADIDPSRITLRADSLTAGSERFFLAAGKREVSAALEAAVGRPGEESENKECGAGPMTFVRFSNAFTANFQNGNLVGWMLNGTGGTIAYDGDVAVGSERSSVEALPGFMMIEGCTLGDEFVLQDEVAGFFEEGRVAMLYAGTQCFFR